MAKLRRADGRGDHVAISCTVAGDHSAITRKDAAAPMRARKGARPRAVVIATVVMVQLLVCGWYVRALLGSRFNVFLASPLRIRGEECEPVEPGPDTTDGIVYICTGKGCNLDLLCNSMALLRKGSRWRGPIFTITDRDELLGGTACRGNFPAFTAVRAPATETLMHMKNFKRRLFDLVGSHHRRLIYVDADILPVGCLGKFLRDHRAENLAMFRDSLCWECNKYLGGFISAHNTTTTQECMGRWMAEVSKEDFRKYHKDQDAFDAVLKAGGCRGAVKALPAAKIETFDDLVLLPFWGRLLGRWPAFQHFSHGIRATSMWPQVDRSIRRQVRERTGYDAGE